MAYFIPLVYICSVTLLRTPYSLSHWYIPGLALYWALSVYNNYDMEKFLARSCDIFRPVKSIFRTRKWHYVELFVP